MAARVGEDLVGVVEPGGLTDAEYEESPLGDDAGVGHEGHAHLDDTEPVRAEPAGQEDQGPDVEQLGSDLPHGEQAEIM